MNALGSSHDQVQWKRPRNGAPDFECLLHVPTFVRHDDQKVHVAIFCRMTIRIGAKENHAFGLESPDNGRCVLANFLETDHGTKLPDLSPTFNLCVRPPAVPKVGREERRESAASGYWER